MSSVVLVIVGLLISYAIQQAQIRSSRENMQRQIAASTAQANAQQRLQEAQLTSQLLQHLVSKEPTQRGVAMVALRSAVPQATYDSIVELLAATDVSSGVRTLAIKQLSTSGSATAAGVLGTIVNDARRPEPERQLAVSASVELGFRKAVATAPSSDSTLVMAASGANEIAWSIVTDSGHTRGAFTWALLRGLRGGADSDKDGAISASELRSFVATKLRAETPFQTPVAIERGADNIVLSPLKYRAVHGIFVGTFPERKREDRMYAALPEAIEDARIVREFFVIVNGVAPAAAVGLLGAEATEARFFQALRAFEAGAAIDDLLIVYFSGRSTVMKDGQVRWLFADSAEDGGVSTSDINKALSKIRARHKVLLVDSNFGGAIGQ